MEYPPKRHIKLDSREVSFTRNLFCNYPIVLKFCIEHGSDTAVLCAKFQNDRTMETGVMDERDFARFEFKISFGRISYTAPFRSLQRFRQTYNCKK